MTIKQIPWVVRGVTPRTDYTLLITFTGGVKKVYDARPLLDIPLYAPLRDISFFMRAKTDSPSVAWSDELDIAPEHLYEKSVPYEG